MKTASETNSDSIQSDAASSAGPGAVTHTPTPWLANKTARKQSNHGNFRCAITRLVKDDNGEFYETLAYAVGGREDSKQFAEKVAAEIERCVNAMPAMLELLEDVGNALTDILGSEAEFRSALPADWGGDPLHDACESARAILTRIDTVIKGIKE